MNDKVLLSIVNGLQKTIDTLSDHMRDGDTAKLLAASHFMAVTGELLHKYATDQHTMRKAFRFAKAESL